MPLIEIGAKNPAVDGRQSDTALDIRHGILAGFAESNEVFLPEFTLPNGRRADLIGMDEKGLISIVEIKSSIADFKSDGKWEDYLAWCDCFYFASTADVPRQIFPEAEGYILADNMGCEIIRPPKLRKLDAARRKSITLKIARAATSRLQKFIR